MDARIMFEKQLDLACWENPPADYRPAPFWSLNELLEPEELSRQIRAMHAQGFGGFFMHARVGLKTPYLSPEWFRMIQVCTEEAAALGMKAWIYDEDRYPSGFAGGEIAEVPGLDYPIFGLACREEDGERRFEIVRSEPHYTCNGAAYPDLLNPEVTAAFIRLSHERYAAAIGDHFGQAVPGSFTDEPSYVMWDNKEMFRFLPWTKHMEAEFRKRRGYELWPNIASLFFDEGDFHRVRIDFYRTLTELFVENYSRPLGEWCAEHGLISTGHMMSEDTLLSQVQAVGAAMPHYRHFQMPGIDHLGGAIFDNPLLPKQCSSVAHQFGGRVLSEIFGGCGWEVPIGDLKPSGDWDYALGVNFLNQHLTYYSIRGCRKRDYPTSWSYHQPAGELYHAFNTYYGRLSYLLTCGEAVRRVLLLHPIATAWALASPLNTGPAADFSTAFARLSALLLETQRDFDYGDEMLMADSARVEGTEMVVGQARYAAVVIPSAISWSPRTFELLQEFTRQGGILVALEPVAREIDGVPSEELAQFLKSHVADCSQEKALAAIPRDVRVTRAGKPVTSLVYQHRRAGERDVYFLTFDVEKKAFTATINLEGEGRVECWDAETGQVTEVPAGVKDGRTICTATIPARGSLLLILDRSSRPTASRTAEVRPVSEPLVGPWTVERLQPNTLLLEQARVKFCESPWTLPMSIAGGGPGPVMLPNVNDLVKQAIIEGHMPPGWPIRMRFDIPVARGGDSIRATRFVIEDPEAMFDLHANGRPLAVAKDDWWLDHQFIAYAVDELAPGQHTIDCQVRWSPPKVPGTMRFFKDGVELENCYLVGDFNVMRQRGRWVLAPPSALPGDPAADLVKAGLPFYAGTLRYTTRLTLPAVAPGRRYLLRFPRPNGEGVRLSVNGKAVRDLWCDPFTADCTAYLRPGENEIRADLFTSLGNVLGLLHHRKPWSDAGHAYEQAFLSKVGLGGVPVLEVR
ncbi:MAG: glycosyl hydrolase [Armatimonadota bacterium]